MWIYIQSYQNRGGEITDKEKSARRRNWKGIQLILMMIVVRVMTAVTLLLPLLVQMLKKVRMRMTQSNMGRKPLMLPSAAATAAARKVAEVAQAKAP